MDKFTLLAISHLVSCILGSVIGFAIAAALYQPTFSKEVKDAQKSLQEEVQRVRILEEYYHEELKNLPDCNYNPSYYNRLFQ